MKATANTGMFINEVIAYTYLGCAAMSFWVTGLSYYFKSGYLPPELGKLKKLYAILGASLRVAWMLLRLAHYFLAIVIAIIGVQVASMPDCVLGTRGLVDYYIMLGMISAVWLLQYAGGTVLRSMMEVDLPIFTPDDPTANQACTCLFFICGP
jgi:hypothetical protein